MIFPFLFGVSILSIVIIIGTHLFFAYKAASILNDQDWSNGIKPVIEKVWCGHTGCLNKQ
jgi:hypothetical protein